MKILCENCNIQHELDPPAWVLSSGRPFRFRCSSCGHAQSVKPTTAEPAAPEPATPEPATPEPAAPEPAAPEPAATTLPPTAPTPSPAAKHSSTTMVPVESSADEPPTPVGSLPRSSTVLPPVTEAPDYTPPVELEPLADTSSPLASGNAPMATASSTAGPEPSAPPVGASPPVSGSNEEPNTPLAATEPPLTDQEAASGGADTESPAVFLKQNGQIYMVRDWETLKQWITERRVERHDLISEGGVRWQPVGSRTDLSHLFSTVETVEASSEPDPPPVAEDTFSGAFPFGGETPFMGGETPFSSMTQPPSVWVDDDTEGVPTGLPGLTDEIIDPFESASLPIAAEEDDESFELPPLDEPAPPALLDATPVPIRNLATPALVATPSAFEDPSPIATDEVLADPTQPVPQPETDSFSELSVEATDESDIDLDWDHYETAEEQKKPGLLARPELLAGAGILTLVLVVLVAIAAFVLLNSGGASQEVGIAEVIHEPPARPAPVTKPPPVVTPEPPEPAIPADAAEPPPEASPSDQPATPAPPPAVVPPEPTPAKAPTKPPTRAKTTPTTTKVPSPAPTGPSTASLISDGFKKLDTGNIGGAGSAFKKALAKSSGNGNANYGYGLVLLEQGKTSQAKSYLCKGAARATGAYKAEAKSVITDEGMSCP